MLAMMDYYNTGKEPNFSGNEKFIWPTIRQRLDLEKSKDTRGPNHWNWKGGITPANQKARNSKFAHEWRKAVFERDNYTCQMCGKHGGKLNAHHIKHWAKFPGERFVLDNGITFCEECHKKIHKR